MPPNRFESEVESFLEGSHGDRTHIKRADHPRLHHYAGHYFRMAQNPHHSRLKCAASPTRPGHSTGWRDNAATLKPTTPLRAPEQQPLKPASPLHPTTAAKTPISHPQRRWRFQSHTGTSEQRRRWFQTTGLPRLQHPNAVPVSGGETAAPKFRMQFDWMKFQ